MKCLPFILLGWFVSIHCIPVQAQKTALLLIDIQDIYFPGGQMSLENPEAAGMNAGLILNRFRDSEQFVIHVRHDMDSGGEIHDYVKPLDGEKVITKNHVNAFIGTELLLILEENGIEQLVICGMQTHLSVEATVRAAHDFGYRCILVGDACATRVLQYKEHIISARNVQFSTLSSLQGHYATLVNTDELLKHLGDYVPQ
ncbi:MAG: cysteine hydrolase [Bacteroidales bacterium]|nr:cysteine hydrolase [Bacteroidales bacterium]MBN2698942.1 cysteine hydrolase [Bacteroidales bacterium]